MYMVKMSHLCVCDECLHLIGGELLAQCVINNMTPHESIRPLQTQWDALAPECFHTFVTFENANPSPSRLILWAMKTLSWHACLFWGISSLIIVRFWQTRTHFKAEKVSWPKIRENFLHANCLWSKFAKISCRENFLFYSIRLNPGFMTLGV